MTDDRPANWDWVGAIHSCRPETMFRQLRASAQKNITTRNGQLGHETFMLTDINGIEFSVSKNAGMHDRIFFKVTDDLAAISVAQANGEPTLYSVGFAKNGDCKFCRGDEQFDAWQVLELALKDFLFG